MNSGFQRHSKIIVEKSNQSAIKWRKLQLSKNKFDLKF